MHLDELFQSVVDLFEILGVAILVVGSAASVVAYARDLSRGERRTAYERLRVNIGRTILVGLEVLIVADIVLTVAIDQTIESALTLGLIVLVRTFLSFSLEIELEGVVPWRRRATRTTEVAAETLPDGVTPNATD
jgi:uncharacterized membrane protein